MTCTSIVYVVLVTNVIALVGLAWWWATSPPKPEQTRLQGMDGIVPPKVRKSSRDH
jgi:hypothetical protein